MEVKIVKSIKDDFSESSGPSTITHAFLSIDGMLFELGRYYEGPCMNEDTSIRLSKVIEFERFLDEVCGIGSSISTNSMNLPNQPIK